jgi:glycosyltransferase involved in cell wall biosynthesis
MNKCTQKSFIKSFIAYLAKKYFYLKNYQFYFDTIIAPSKFTADIFRKTNRFRSNKIAHLPTFIWKENIAENVKEISEQKKLCYFGRIADDKGIITVLKALKILKNENISPILSIMGDDDNEYAKELKIFIKKWELDNVEFLGYKKKAELLSTIKNYAYSVIPSLWYDNMPNSLIESQAMGLPIIASKIGSLNELVIDGFNGFLFEPENEMDLAQVIKKAIQLTNKDIITLSENSINWTKTNCSEEKHYSNLLSIFENALK